MPPRTIRWVFVPSYRDGGQTWEGKTPYGIYPAKRFQTHDDFILREDYDRISSPYFNSETYDVYAMAANRWTR